MAVARNISAVGVVLVAALASVNCAFAAKACAPVLWTTAQTQRASHAVVEV